MESLDNKTTNQQFIQQIENLIDYIEFLVNEKNLRKQDEIKNPTIENLKNTFQENSTEKSPEEESQQESFAENENTENENTEKSDFDTPPEDKDEYIPQNSEFGEAIGEQSRFAEIYPPFLGYYTQGKKSYFNRETNLWSKKKQLNPFHHELTNQTKIYTYTGVITSGINAIPLPDGAWPDTGSLCSNGNPIPEFQVDQNGCIYLISQKKQFISFNFGLNQHTNDKTPIKEDSDNIIYDSLSKDTQELLNKLKNSQGSTQEIATAIKYYIIKNKKYSTRVQGTLRDKSNRDNYIKNLDESPILECFSANSLFVALCRELGLPSRLVVGHMIQSVNKEGKANLTKNDGHARSEIRDESIGKRIRIDATPTQKEDGKNSNENGQEQNNNQSNPQNTDNNFSNEQQSSDNQQNNKENGQGNNQGNSKGQPIENNSEEPPKSPEELLDEMIKKATEDNLLQQSEQMKNVLDKLKNANTTQEIKDTLDQSGLSDFAKDMVDKIGNDQILEDEKKKIKSLDDEKKINEALQNSSLSEKYREKLEEYANKLKQKIEEDKRNMQEEMKNLGFNKDELNYYKEYKELENEVEPEVRQQIKELEEIMPTKYKITRDSYQTYYSGPRFNQRKLTDFAVTKDPRVFERDKKNLEGGEINMFETIIIDTSGSMGNFETPGSILRESIKAAIIRAKVLEHFKVDFSIILFGDEIHDVMNFGEKFSSRSECSIPGKLIRAAHISGGNSQEPITYVYNNMIEQFSKRRGKTFGNISFIGDGDLYHGRKIPELKNMIENLKNYGFGVTAYYINNKGSNLIEYYFGTPEDGGAVYAGDSKELANEIVESHRNYLRNKLKQYFN